MAPTVKLTEAQPVEPGQEFFIDRFRPGDATGVASLFRAVYGEHYPWPQYYDPEWLAAANAAGHVYSVVARTPGGDIVSHMALYRSAAANPALYEYGIGMTLPAYRGMHASSRIARYIAGLLPNLPLDGIYGEPVTSHTVTQKYGDEINTADTAVEIDLMPAEIYDAGKSAPGRVSCLFYFLALKDTPQTLHVPARYLDAARFILKAVPVERTVVPSAAAPAAEPSRLETRIFDFASVSRSQLFSCGRDIAAALDDMERQADEKRCTTRQVFLNLADPAIGRAAELLRDRGYFLAGLTPQWFGSDGMLLQKMLHRPDFARIVLHHDRTRQLLALVEDDWRAVNEGRP